MNNNNNTNTKYIMAVYERERSIITLRKAQVVEKQKKNIWFRVIFGL